MFKKFLLTFLLLGLLGCQKENPEWNPIFEDTGFEYFNTEIQRTLTTLDEAYAESENKHTDGVQEKLRHIKKRLIEIKDYYVPLTAIRQKIYDAERFFKLKDFKKSEQLLNASKTILNSIELTTKNKVFDKVILELESMLDEVIFSLNGDPINTYQKLKILGTHINLMLSRGDLVLSGIEFNQ